MSYLLVLLLPLATVGPNIGDGGARTEHIYAVVAVVVLWSLHGLPLPLTVPFSLVLVTWIAVTSLAIVGGLLPAEQVGIPADSIIRELVGRFGPPIFGLLIGAYIWAARPAIAGGGARQTPVLLERMMLVVVLVACANAIVATASAVMDIGWLDLFRAGRDTVTVGDQAAGGGRYGGVVNQPVEAGMLYSVALLTVARQWKTQAIGMGWFVAFSIVISIGGAVSGSKGFLFGGVPITLAYLLLSGPPAPVRKFVGAGMAALGSVAAAWYVLSTYNSRGLSRMNSLYAIWESEVSKSALFGGRFDAGGSTMGALWTAVAEMGWFGVGVPNMWGAYDIGLLEFAASAGWVGVGAMVLISMVLLVWSASLGFDRYWLSLTLLVLLINIGAPAFTANRNALVVWVLFGAMLQLRQHHRRGAPGRVWSAAQAEPAGGYPEPGGGERGPQR